MQGLSPLQDKNHPQILAHYRRMSEGGDLSAFHILIDPVKDVRAARVRDRFLAMRRARQEWLFLP